MSRENNSMVSELGCATNAWQPLASAKGPKPKLFSQLFQHGLTGLLGFGERLEGWSAHPDGRPVDTDGPPRSNKARPPAKPRTTATLVTNHQREVALARAPYLQLRCCRTNAAEVQCHLTLKQAKTAPGFRAAAADLTGRFSPGQGLRGHRPEAMSRRSRPQRFQRSAAFSRRGVDHPEAT